MELLSTIFAGVVSCQGVVCLPCRTANIRGEVLKCYHERMVTVDNRSRYIPALVTLMASFFACILSIYYKYTTRETVFILLITIVVFFVIGLIIKKIADTFLQVEILEEETPESETPDVEQKDSTEQDK